MTAINFRTYESATSPNYPNYMRVQLNHRADWNFMHLWSRHLPLFGLLNGSFDVFQRVRHTNVDTATARHVSQTHSFLMSLVFDVPVSTRKTRRRFVFYVCWNFVSLIIDKSSLKCNWKNGVGGGETKRRRF